MNTVVRESVSCVVLLNTNNTHTHTTDANPTATQVIVKGRAADDRFAAFYIAGMILNMLELVHIILVNRMWLGAQGKMICGYLAVMTVSRSIEAAIWAASFAEADDDKVRHHRLKGIDCIIQ